MSELSSHLHFAVIEQHAVHFLNGSFSSLMGLKVHKAVPFRAILVTNHLQEENVTSAHVKHGRSHESITTAPHMRLRYLAGQNVPEGREGIVQSLVVDGFVQVLDENVAHAALAQRRVTLRPHDPDGSALDDIKVHGVQGAFS